MNEQENVDGGVLQAASLDHSLGYKLRLAQILAYRSFEEKVTDYGVAPRYLGLLAIVGDNPGQRQIRLAETIGLQRSSLVAILDRLEADGLLERRASEEDRRSKAVWLTAEGSRVLAELSKLATEHEASMTDGLAPGARAAVMAGLDAIIGNLRRIG